MNFRFVDVSGIDAVEPIFPNSRNWDNVTHYPFSGIDGAFIVEGTVERFRDNTAWHGFFTQEDFVAKKVLQAPPMLHAWEQINAVTTAEGTPIFILQKPYEDKESENLPRYDELFERIVQECTGDSLITGYPPMIDDLRLMYKDLRKFKRKNLYFNEDYSHIQYRHTNPNYQLARECAYSWIYQNDGQFDECSMTPTDQYGFFARPYNVIQGQFEDARMLLDYHGHVEAYNARGTEVVFLKDYYWSKWQETSVIFDDALGFPICRIPQAYYAQSDMKNMLDEVEGGFGTPHAYTYQVGSDEYVSQRTIAWVEVSPRFVFADLDLNTEF